MQWLIEISWNDTSLVAFAIDETTISFLFIAITFFILLKSSVR